MEYYEIEDNLDLPSRWFLDDLLDAKGRRLDGRDFTYGRRIDPGPPLKVSLWSGRIMAVGLPLKFSLYGGRTGSILDFTFSNDDVPVVTGRVAVILAATAGDDIQRFPVQVEGRKESYEIINVVSCIPCVDRDRSDADWWTEADGRPEK